MTTPNASPVTGIIEEDQVIIDFGKYEGKSVHEIADLDPSFYERLAKEKESGVFAMGLHRPAPHGHRKTWVPWIARVAGDVGQARDIQLTGARRPAFGDAHGHAVLPPRLDLADLNSCECLTLLACRRWNA